MGEAAGMIPKSECKHGYLYRIHSRNLILGVFNELTGGFIGLRSKFGDIYAFEEFHWDNGPPYGTVKPIEELEKLPEGIEVEESLGSFCGNCKMDCTYVPFPDGPREKTFQRSDGTSYTSNISGEWKHNEPGDCLEVLSYNKRNDVLEKWLAEMKVKYS